MAGDEASELQDRAQKAGWRGGEGAPRLSPNKTWAVNHNLGVLN